MFKTLLLFILSCVRASFDILRIAIINLLLPRMPLPNWRKENISVVQVDDVQVGQVENSRIVKLWNRASTSGPDYDFANGDEKAARVEFPNPFIKYSVLVDKANVITPTKPSIVGFEFSLDSNIDFPQDARHPFLTPVRPPIKEVGITILRNASDRVTEILRENRRRLDAGEDLNTIRKAARRKRAMELFAVRKGRAKLSSLA